jgi:hypothetical protein
MPDDEKATEQKEEKEEVQVDEDEKAFAEEIEDEKEADEKEKATKDEKEKEEKALADKEKEDKEKLEKKDEKKETEKDAEEKAEKEKEEKELSAKEKLDKHLETIKDEEEEPTPSDKDKEEKEKAEKEKKDKEEAEKKLDKEPEPLKLTEELISERLKLISSDDLPGQIIIGDETIDLKRYAEDYPDDYAAIRVLSSLTAEKMIEKALDGISFAKPGEADTKIESLELKVNQLSFDNTILRATDKEGNVKHPDALTIIYGEGMKDFHKWIKEQSPKMQKLANSLEPEDGILILDYYKEDTAKKKTPEHDKKTKNKKKEHDENYKSEKSLKKNQQESSPGDKSADEEAEESFNEE